MKAILLLLASLALGGCALIQQWFGPPPPCQEPAYRQFDFWLGDWQVQRLDANASTATNSISLIMQGCALKEQYQTDTGYSGESLNWYDPELGQWRQSWVDNAGTALQLAGGLTAEGEMVLEGSSRRDDRGELIRDRITWRQVDGGAVLQVWESFSPSLQEWQRVFEGLYTPSSKDSD